jgi:GC-rich sequence DNA-binding factor
VSSAYDLAVHTKRSELTSDLAEYTEAKDRLYIGKKANKDAARRMKGEIGEMIADV